MTLSYPQTEGHGYEFSKAEIDLNGKIYTAIANISHNQPIEEGVGHGAAAEPLFRTRGQLQKGEGSIEWSDIGEMQEFLDDLGDGYCETEFKATIVYTATGRKALTRTLIGCRLLDVEEEGSSGPDPIGSTTPFSFMYRLLNGKKALKNQRV
jgi:hypothetical protein